MLCTCVNKDGLRCVRETADLDEFPDIRATWRGGENTYCAICLHGVCDEGTPGLAHEFATSPARRNVPMPRGSVALRGAATTTSEASTKCETNLRPE